MNYCCDTTINIALPTQVRFVLGSIENAGWEAWCVGGCVRDSLLNRKTNDYDIASNASWTKVESILSDAGCSVHRTGTKHGTVTATFDGYVFEITTYRSESTYSDGRHPDEVEFIGSIEEDLARRDFTINAMAYHPVRGLLDCFSGRADLQAKLIRAVGDPVKRFKEDGLRILRGCRFSSELGFSIEPKTLQAMTACKMMLQQVSAERITHEMDRLLLGSAVCNTLIETVGVLTAIFPEFAACKGFEQHTPYHIYDVWEHTARVVSFAPATRLGRWSALLHDIGKPGAFFMEGDRGHFYGHGRLSVILAESIFCRLKISPTFAKKALTLIRIHDYQIAPTKCAVCKVLEKLNGDVDLFETLLGLKRADALAQSELSRPRLELVDQLQTLLDEILISNEAFTVAQLAINGEDIKALGVKPDPQIGALLRDALNAVVEEQVANERDNLLSYIAKKVDEGTTEVN